VFGRGVDGVRCKIDCGGRQRRAAEYRIRVGNQRGRLGAGSDRQGICPHDRGVTDARCLGKFYLHIGKIKQIAGRLYLDSPCSRRADGRRRRTVEGDTVHGTVGYRSFRRKDDRDRARRGSKRPCAPKCKLNPIRRRSRYGRRVGGYGSRSKGGGRRNVVCVGRHNRRLLRRRHLERIRPGGCGVDHTRRIPKHDGDGTPSGDVLLDLYIERLPALLQVLRILTVYGDVGLLDRVGVGPGREGDRDLVRPTDQCRVDGKRDVVLGRCTDQCVGHRHVRGGNVGMYRPGDCRQPKQKQRHDGRTPKKIIHRM